MGGHLLSLSKRLRHSMGPLCKESFPLSSHFRSSTLIMESGREKSFRAKSWNSNSSIGCGNLTVRLFLSSFQRTIHALKCRDIEERNVIWHSKENFPGD